MVFCKLDDTSDVQYSLKINPDFFWTLHSFRRPIDTSACSILQHVPSLLTTVASVKAVVNSLQRCIVCAGNEDPKFLELAIVRNGNFNDMSGKYKSASLLINNYSY